MIDPAFGPVGISYTSRRPSAATQPCVNSTVSDLTVQILYAFGVAVIC
jgi:hypothetical protein